MAALESVLPNVLAALHEHPAATVAAQAEASIRQYVPKPADRARLVEILKHLVARLETTA